ncbi:hypothetical protein [Streptomyces sp. MK37H]|nr:hypothetical protein [Streptomyces sp. MK37H]MBP8536039.1 hypothetical protein [Streptomyces sp. MK37H]
MSLRPAPAASGRGGRGSGRPGRRVGVLPASLGYIAFAVLTGAITVI